ncbi:BTB/POZ domain-containing protein [Nymphaea thermarum]|nr:BTB/POZ domain-containing protein [Nymphaea thermarum]
MASEKVGSRGQAWFCTTGLPSDVIVEVEDMAFHLHKFPLMSKSGKLHRMITDLEVSMHQWGERDEEAEDDDEEETESYLLSLPGFPGGTEAFEIAAKFCYGVKVELTASNVAPLLCAAEYLEMTEEHGAGNLAAKTEAFLNQTVLRSLKDAIRTLSTCERLLPEAEDLGISRRCIDAIAIKAGTDPSLFGWPVAEGASGELAKPSGSVTLSGFETGRRRRGPVRSAWWYDELTVLGLPFFKRVIAAMIAREVCPESIEGSLVSYAKKFIPGLSRRNRGASSSLSAAVASEDEQRELLETVVSHMTVRKSSNPSTTTKLLFGLLRTANILSASEGCRETLERKIAAQLDQATLDNLLLPSYSYLIETLYDIDCVERILGLGEQKKGQTDALAHPWISDDEREKICGMMDCQKLTLEACTHAAQNERLPLRVVVQVLFFEQLQLRNAIAGSFAGTDVSMPLMPDSARPSRLQDHIGFLGQSPAGQPWQPNSRDNQGFRLDMDSMKARVHELERECSTMRRAIRKIDKTSRGGNGGGSGSGSGVGAGCGGVVDGEIGGNGGWSSFTKKFGCKFKTQVCDSHERTWVESRKGNHHRNPSLL